ncbi:ribonuclease H-like domain-containing protein, partial [Chlamydoabsidia padenii]
EKVFGLDMEWKPSFVKGRPQNPVGLIQICGVTRILLIQVAQMKGLSPGLIEFLMDPKIYKTGVNIRGDGVKLYRDYRVVTDGLLDLRPLAESALKSLPVPGHFHSSKTLRSLTGIFLGLKVDKGSIRMSNWNAETLNAKQVDYAANDAFVSL